MPIQPNKDNLITYSSLQGDRRSFTGNQRKDDYINKQLLTGKWGYDESSGGLSRLKTPVKVSKNNQTSGKSDYYESGHNINEEELTQSYIDGTNKSKRAKDSYLNAGHSAVVNNPAFKAAAFMTPPGMIIGAMEGAANIIPDSYNFAKDPSWKGAGSVAMDALMMTPAAAGAAKEVSKAVGKAIKTPAAKELLNNSESMRSRINALRYLKMRATPGRYSKAKKALKDANNANAKYWNDPKTEEAFKTLYKGDFVPHISDKFINGKGLLPSGKIDGVLSRHGSDINSAGRAIENIRNQGYLNKFPSMKDVMSRAWKGEEQLVGLQGNPQGLGYTSGVSKGSPYQYGYKQVDNISSGTYFDKATNWAKDPKEVLRRQNYVDPILSPESIRGTVIHEGNHGITADGLAESPRVANLLQKAWNFTDDLGEKLTHPEYGDGFSLNARGKYITSNDEMYARMQELRDGIGIKPGQKITGEEFHAGLVDNIGKFEKSQIAPDFFKSIDSFGMVNAMNGLPVAVGAAAIMGPEKDTEVNNTKMKYKKGGWFQSTKAGRGVRDVARLSVNSALNPVEGLLGTDFGFDEKYGYSNDWAKTAGKVTEGVGTAIGGVANSYVNTIVPGSGAALKAVGSGLENSGVTQAQDGPGAIGTQVGQAAGIFMGGEPPISAEDGVKMKKYGVGGKADLEAEGGEVVLTQGGAPNAANANASMTKLGDGAYKINGNSHGKGGVDMEMPNGESVIINKKDAPIAQKYIKLLETAKKDSKSGDFITKATGDLNVPKYTKALDGIVAAQQARNGNKSNVMKAKDGSKWDGKKIPQTMNPNIFPQDISSSIHGLGFDPQSIPGNEAGSYSNMDRSVSLPRYGLEKQNGQRPFEGRREYELDNRMFNKNRHFEQGGRYMKAEDGVQFNNPLPFDPHGEWASAGVYSMMGTGNIHNQSGNPISNNFLQDGQTSGPGFMERSNQIPSITRGVEPLGTTSSPLSGRESQPPLNINEAHNKLFGTNPPTQVSAEGRQARGEYETQQAQQAQQQTANANASSFGVFAGDMNAEAPFQGNGPQNMPEGYTTPEGYQTTPRPPAKVTPQRGGRFDKLSEMFKGKGMSNLTPYASSAYNIGMGIAGIINPAEGLDANDYTTEKLKDPKKIDPYSQTAEANQISATFLNNESDPARRQAYASQMAPKIAKTFGEVNYLNDQRQSEVDKSNIGIAKDNNQVRLGIKGYNDKLAAAPYEFLKEGFGQAANTSLALEGNETLRSMSGTSNYDMGQYIAGLSPQERAQFGKLLNKES